MPVPHDAVKTDAERWTFYDQLDNPVAPQDCYTGAGAGWRMICIMALPAA